MSVSVVACPRNQPFRTTRFPSGTGLFFVWIVLVRKANECGQITLELDLKGAFDGMKAYLINEPTNDARRLFPCAVLGEARPQPLNFLHIEVGDVLGGYVRGRAAAR